MVLKSVVTQLYAQWRISGIQPVVNQSHLINIYTAPWKIFWKMLSFICKAPQQMEKMEMRNRDTVWDTAEWQFIKIRLGYTNEEIKLFRNNPRNWHATNKKGNQLVRNNLEGKTQTMLSILYAMLRHYCETNKMISSSELQKICLSANRLSVIDIIQLGLNRLAVSNIKNNDPGRFMKKFSEFVEWFVNIIL